MRIYSLACLYINLNRAPEDKISHRRELNFQNQADRLYFFCASSSKSVLSIDGTTIFASLDE